MSDWRWDLADEGYFGEPQDFPANRAEPYWKADLTYWVKEAAAVAADIYWHNHDGWESSWPVTFRIYPPDTDEFEVVEVDMEMEPVFIGLTPKPEKEET